MPSLSAWPARSDESCSIISSSSARNTFDASLPSTCVSTTRDARTRLSRTSSPFPVHRRPRDALTQSLCSPDSTMTTGAPVDTRRAAPRCPATFSCVMGFVASTGLHFGASADKTGELGGCETGSDSNGLTPVASPYTPSSGPCQGEGRRFEPGVPLQFARISGGCTPGSGFLAFAAQGEGRRLSWGRETLLDSKGFLE